MAGYGDESGFTDWLAANGHELPDDAPAAAVLIERGSVYIDGTYGARFSGIPTGGFAQERQWPRTGAYAHGQPIPDNVIPDAVIKASYAAAWQEATEPGSLSASFVANERIKRVKAAVTEVEFADVGADAGVMGQVTVLSAVEGLLAPFFIVPQPTILVV